MPAEKLERAVLAFGKRLRKLRMRRGLTQRELAELCGLTPGQISHYEAGRHRPHPRNLARLAQELQVAVQTLAGSLAARTARPGRRTPGRTIPRHTRAGRGWTSPQPGQTAPGQGAPAHSTKEP